MAGTAWAALPPGWSDADIGSPGLAGSAGYTNGLWTVTVNPLTSPSVSSLAWNNGQFTMQINGQSGPDYAVQVSTDLVNWTMVFTTNSPPMPLGWVDTNAAVAPVQFYRILVGPRLP